MLVLIKEHSQSKNYWLFVSKMRIGTSIFSRSENSLQLSTLTVNHSPALQYTVLI